MQTLRTTLLALALLLVAALSVHAQVTSEHVIKQGQPITLAWDAGGPGSSLPDDQVAGYDVAAFDIVQMGTGTKVAVKTWGVGNVLTHTIPADEVPATPRPFFVSVRTRTVAGLLSVHSNSLSFRDPSAPSAPTGLRVAP